MTHRIRSAFRAVIDHLKHSNILNYTAQLSYGLTLAFIPILMLFTFGIHFLSSYSDIKQEVGIFITDYFPEFLSDFILPTLNSTYLVEKVSGLEAIGSNIALIFFIVYAALRLLRSLMIISTKILGETELRSLIKIWVLAVRYLFQLVFFLVTIFAFYLESEYLLEKINILWVQSLLNLLASLMLLASFILLLAWVMAKFPSQKLKIKQALPGACFTIFGWIALIEVYRFLIVSLNYTGAILIASQALQIIITIYLLSFILLLGFIINYTYIEEGKFDKKF